MAPDKAMYGSNRLICEEELDDIDPIGVPERSEQMVRIDSDQFGLISDIEIINDYQSGMV